MHAVDACGWTGEAGERTSFNVELKKAAPVAADGRFRLSALFSCHLSATEVEQTSSYEQVKLQDTSVRNVTDAVMIQLIYKVQVLFSREFSHPQPITHNPQSTITSTEASVRISISPAHRQPG